jgi:DNA invertase Pin-like site-specific DNA recombinase
MKETIIYLRTSTEEQTPELQLKDCEALARKINLVNYEVLQEKQSAFKDIVREVFSRIQAEIKTGKISSLIVWDLDRLYRNRKKLIEFFNFCKVYNCKIYSVRQEFLNAFDNLKLPFGFEFLSEMYRDNFLQFLGWIAEEESSKKSERVKNAVVRKDKQGNLIKTISYKGNKWGRKALSKNVINQVLELHKQGLSMRQISKQVFYWDKNNNQKQIALSSVHKIITKHNNSQT